MTDILYSLYLLPLNISVKINIKIIPLQHWKMKRESIKRTQWGFTRRHTIERKRLTANWCSSKVTADGDCSHEIKRCLLLGRKAVINLGSVLKSRDMTLLTMVHLVKSMVFPVVRYGCELDHKEAKHQRIDAFQLWCWKKFLESPLDSKEIKPVHAKENQPWIFIGRTDAEAEAPTIGHLMWRANSFAKTLMLGNIEGKRRWGQQSIR